MDNDEPRRPPDRHAETGARRRGAGALMRILFATTVLPHERRTGGEIATLNFLEALTALGHEVHVVGYRRPGAVAAQGKGWIDAGTRPIELAEAGWRRSVWAGQALARGAPLTNVKFTSRAYRNALAAAKPEAADLLVLDHAHMGWLDALRGLPRNRVFLAHNVEHRLYSTMAEHRGGPAGWFYRREAALLEPLERRLLHRSCQAWCLTRADAAALGQLSPDPGKLRVFDLPGQAVAGEALAVPSYDIGMIGSWNWEVNRTGLQWFLDKVLPRLPKGLRIAVAGSGSEGLDRVDPRLVGLGRVPDAGRFMQECHVLAAPTVVGSGVQLKTIEGIAAGRPMVATSVALRDIRDVPDHVRMADSPEVFARALCHARRAGAPSPRAGSQWLARRRDRFFRQVAMATFDLGVADGASHG